MCLYSFSWLFPFGLFIGLFVYLFVGFQRIFILFVRLVQQNPYHLIGVHERNSINQRLNIQFDINKMEIMIVCAISNVTHAINRINSSSSSSRSGCLRKPIITLRSLNPLVELMMKIKSTSPPSLSLASKQLGKKELQNRSEFALHSFKLIWHACALDLL